MCLSPPVFDQAAKGVIWLLVRPMEVSKLAFEKNDVINWHDFGCKNSPFGSQKLSSRIKILYTGWRLYLLNNIGVGIPFL